MNITTEIKCPGCETEIKVEISKMFSGNTIDCPKPDCNSKLEFEGDDGRDMQDALDGLSKTLKNFGKK
ncbi:hypothetical protein [Moritella sp. 28]|uniref:hypothetical protein n=1 Tax=Moritella sp. 28 TaxID=2746232 RepID=UPI001BAB0F10|nr:hypothetical protein [Moritella sp. 28]QUM85974.1 hypothetical protein HWV02_16390 [Moritella sp. 28]